MSPFILYSDMQRFWPRIALIALISLISLCVLWEIQLAPLRPQGSWLALKALPLCVPLTGVYQKKLFTFQWASMLILLYLAEGLVRAFTDTGPSTYLAYLEILFSAIFFISALAYVAPFKRAYKAKHIGAKGIRND